jgi:hypothetical protein
MTGDDAKALTVVCSAFERRLRPRTRFWGRLREGVWEGVWEGALSWGRRGPLR